MSSRLDPLVQLGVVEGGHLTVERQVPPYPPSFETQAERDRYFYDLHSNPALPCARPTGFNNIVGRVNSPYDALTSQGMGGPNYADGSRMPVRVLVEDPSLNGVRGGFMNARWKTYTKTAFYDPLNGNNLPDDGDIAAVQQDYRSERQRATEELDEDPTREDGVIMVGGLLPRPPMQGLDRYAAAGNYPIGNFGLRRTDEDAPIAGANLLPIEAELHAVEWRSYNDVLQGTDNVQAIQSVNGIHSVTPGIRSQAHRAITLGNDAAMGDATTDDPAYDINAGVLRTTETLAANLPYAHADKATREGERVQHGATLDDLCYGGNDANQRLFAPSAHRHQAMLAKKSMEDAYELHRERIANDQVWRTAPEPLPGSDKYDLSAPTGLINDDSVIRAMQQDTDTFQASRVLTENDLAALPPPTHITGQAELNYVGIQGMRGGERSLIPVMNTTVRAANREDILTDAQPEDGDELLHQWNQTRLDRHDVGKLLSTIVHDPSAKYHNDLEHAEAPGVGKRRAKTQGKE